MKYSVRWISHKLDIFLQYQNSASVWGFWKPQETPTEIWCLLHKCLLFECTEIQSLLHKSLMFEWTEIQTVCCTKVCCLNGLKFRTVCCTKVCCLNVTETQMFVAQKFDVWMYGTADCKTKGYNKIPNPKNTNEGTDWQCKTGIPHHSICCWSGVCTCTNPRRTVLYDPASTSAESIGNPLFNQLWTNRD